MRQHLKDVFPPAPDQIHKKRGAKQRSDNTNGHLRTRYSGPCDNVGPDEQNTAEERGSRNERLMIRTRKRPHHVGHDEPDKPDDAAESDSNPHYERYGYQEDLLEVLHGHA